MPDYSQASSTFSLPVGFDLHFCGLKIAFCAIFDALKIIILLTLSESLEPVLGDLNIQER